MTNKIHNARQEPIVSGDSRGKFKPVKPSWSCGTVTRKCSFESYFIHVIRIVHALLSYRILSHVTGFNLHGYPAGLNEAKLQ